MVTREQAAELRADVGQALDPAALPFLLPMAAPILAAWQEMGAPTIVAGGLMLSVRQGTTAAYAARREWLDEHEVHSIAERTLYLETWAHLDAVHCELIREEIDEHKPEKPKASR